MKSPIELKDKSIIIMQEFDQESTRSLLCICKIVLVGLLFKVHKFSLLEEDSHFLVMCRGLEANRLQGSLLYSHTRPRK